MQIYKMNPVFKNYLWGGKKLEEKYGKKSPYEFTAESWEIASHKNGETTVLGGTDDALTVTELINKYRERLLGDKVYTKNYSKFPLLIKFIDARDNLSVQVHPDDIQAARLEKGELGKTEMWYVLDADKGAGLLYGLKKTITREEFCKAVKNNTFLEYMNFVPCKKGDCFFIPAGMLHAIGKGLLIAEIQQNSDTTYRVYDYDRRDAEGNSRELHIEKAAEVATLSATEIVDYDSKIENIVKCNYFTTEIMNVNGTNTINVSNDRFEILIVCEGEVKINGIKYKGGDTLLIPAYIGKIEIIGKAELLRTHPTV